MVTFKNSDAGRVNDGYADEKNDCTVRAAVVRFATSYKRAHELCANVGRRERRGLKLKQVKELLENMGLEVIRPIIRPTLKQFIDQNPAGRFYVCIRGHAIGINNGIIVDTFAPRVRARVLLYA